MRTMSALTISLFLASAAAAQEHHSASFAGSATPAGRIQGAIQRLAIPPAPPSRGGRLRAVTSHAQQPSYRPVRRPKSTRALAIGLGAFCGFLGGGLIGARVDASLTGSGKRGFLIGAPLGAVVGGLAGAQLSR